VGGKRPPGTVLLSLLMILSAATAAPAQDGSARGEDLDYAQVLFVRAAPRAGETWGFAVTVRHQDEGWEHYADAWQVVDPRTGQVLAERVLAHPHEQEQPFTRSLSGVSLPAGVTRVLIRARCNVHGFGGREILVDLDRSRGEGFEVSGGSP
jgi:hypothetical protein